MSSGNGLRVTKFSKNFSKGLWKAFNQYPVAFNSFPNDKFHSSKLEEFSNLMKMAESSPNRQKRLWEKEKLHVTSNFSFSQSVLKRFVRQACKSQGLFGKGLNS